MNVETVSRLSLSISNWILYPVFTLLVFTPWSGQLDQRVTQFFFTDGHFISSALLDFIYQYGLYPAWIVVLGSLFIFILTFFNCYFKKWRQIALYFILILTIGSGLIIHVLLKDHWGRPRPKQVIEYGGQQPFRPYYLPKFTRQIEPSKSFPCGHCSMGFYFFGLALVGKLYKSRLIYYFGLTLAWGLGGMLSFVRIAQGGHFFSDVVVSGLIMWWTAWGLCHFMFKERQDES